MSALRIAGWLLAALNVVAGMALLLGRDGGDAATRGLGRALGVLVALLALAAAGLLYWSGQGGGRGFAVVVACVVGVTPLAIVGLTLTPRGLALLYPGLRDARPMRPAPQYRFADAAAGRAALAIVHRDSAQLDSILHDLPARSLGARDELGQTLLGIAAYTAVSTGATARDVAVVERLLAMGAQPRHDDLGRDDSLLERLASAPGAEAPAVLALLLKAGLDPNAPSADGGSVLLYPFLQPEAARLLLAHGADGSARDPSPDRYDWSAVTVAADQRHWATAAALLAGGVPPDHATPRGSVLADVIAGIEPLLDATDRADASYLAFMAVAVR